MRRNSNQQVTLDRVQREALRKEFALRGNGWGDFYIRLVRGDRDGARDDLKRLQRVMDMMDAIGWTEQPEAPDRQTVELSRPTAVMARTLADEITESLDNREPEEDLEDQDQDQELDALVALRALGGVA